MAQVKAISFDMPEFKRVKIGHNREIERAGNKIRCFLYGHNICTIQEPGNDTVRIILDDCGYRTVTTRAAMQDFARAIGARLGVSFAKGGFGIRYMGSDSEYADCDSYYGQSFIAKIDR